MDLLTLKEIIVDQKKALTFDLQKFPPFEREAQKQLQKLMSSKLIKVIMAIR